MTHTYTLTRSLVSASGAVKPISQSAGCSKSRAVEQLISHALRLNRQGWQVKFEDDTAFTALKGPDGMGFYYEIEAA